MIEISDRLSRIGLQVRVECSGSMTTVSVPGTRAATVPEVVHRAEVVQDRAGFGELLSRGCCGIRLILTY